MDTTTIPSKARAGDGERAMQPADMPSLPLRRMLQQLALLQEDLRHPARHAVARTAHAVQAHPWAAVLLAGAAAVLIGWLVRRR